MKKYLSLAALALVLTPYANADESSDSQSPKAFAPHVYVEATAGSATALDGCDGVSDDICDDQDTGLRLAFGYQLNQQGFLEVGFINFGEVNYDFSDYVDAKAEVTALYGMGGIMLPTQYAEFYGKGGFALTRVDISAESPFRKVSNSGTGLAAIGSVGVHVPLTDNFGLVGQMDYVVDAGDEDETGTSDMFFISAGAKLSF
ncbi:outer membrane beta-barrel protein [Hahella ganghwensis]|uniref:outer membrane beta-barrel protein n=1 Tax=Hahella ganghwensis TaxID=286420 RepID=UPI00037DDDD2|nr:outer membrane beta-barrel protein [Hahella ganghwensis]